MAPTETLAEQHAATLDGCSPAARSPSPCSPARPGARGGARRSSAWRAASSALVVGTHALIEPAVEFARLGVCVVDEQHRFGVRQRARARREGAGGLAPHVLHMTATPIPRTLSLTAYGDLDTTALRELPAGRRPVRTWLVEEERRAGAYEFIRERLREGRQAFVVCPLVASRRSCRRRRRAREAERLAASELRDFEVEVLHGQMPSAREGGGDGAFRRRARPTCWSRRA